jgi:hypothetical protein
MWSWLYSVLTWVGNLSPGIRTLLGGVLLGMLANWLTPVPKTILAFVASRVVAMLVFASVGYSRWILGRLRRRLVRIEAYHAFPQIMYAHVLRHLLYGLMFGFFSVILIVLIATSALPNYRGEVTPRSGVLVSIAVFTFALYRMFINLASTADDILAVMTYETYKPKITARIQSLEERVGH